MGTLNLVFRVPSKIKKSKKGDSWVMCEVCNAPQFRLAPITRINGLVWECRNPECKHKMVITV